MYKYVSTETRHCPRYQAKRPAETAPGAVFMLVERPSVGWCRKLADRSGNSRMVRLAESRDATPNSHAYGLLHAICATAVRDGLLPSESLPDFPCMNPSRKREPVILDVEDICGSSRLDPTEIPRLGSHRGMVWFTLGRDHRITTQRYQRRLRDYRDCPRAATFQPLAERAVSTQANQVKRAM